MVSVYVMDEMVMLCTVQYREMCYGTNICNVCNGDGVYGTDIYKCNSPRLLQTLHQ